MLYSALKNVSAYYPTVSATLMCSDYIDHIEKQTSLFKFKVLGCTWDTADNVGKCLPEWNCEKEAFKVYVQETPATNDVMLIENWQVGAEGWPVE
ncbi:hypothetical protein V7S43_016499 [Phytophthora oleae]|uniref:Uncharacterized protein n=1 Tax=Phytophthora oleae TaxID=2107226 RepID=A0ABD3EZX2_9STRA